MKEGIAAPTKVIDINALSLGAIDSSPERLTIGALARMSDVAAHPAVRREFQAIAQALERSASPQIRNMASLGGNLMQRTRCPYFRADVDLPCNKRRPGSGCAAMEGENRLHSIFGWSEACIATHPSDVAVALAAFDATIRLTNGRSERSVPINDFYKLPEDTPELETVLQPGELIVAIDVPAPAPAWSSHYLKVRERTSYEFALVSAAAALRIEGGRISEVRIALGGVAPKPWRLIQAENALRNQEFRRDVLEDAVQPGFAAARPLAHNAFKVELAKRAAVRALLMAGGEA
jgi:xanthine dehydrogenase YagS FAD-binding subunit